MRIHQAAGRNRNGPTTAEYRLVPKRIIYALAEVGSLLREVKKRAKLTKNEELKLYRQDIIETGITAELIDYVLSLARLIEIERLIERL